MQGEGENERGGWGRDREINFALNTTNECLLDRLS